MSSYSTLDVDRLIVRRIVPLDLNNNKPPSGYTLISGCNNTSAWLNPARFNFDYLTLNIQNATNYYTQENEKTFIATSSSSFSNLSLITLPGISSNVPILSNESFIIIRSNGVPASQNANDDNYHYFICQQTANPSRNFFIWNESSVGAVIHSSNGIYSSGSTTSNSSNYIAPSSYSQYRNHIYVNSDSSIQLQTIKL